MEGMTLDELIFTALGMLFGIEGRDWEYYETDPYWWALRLWLRRN